MTRLLPRPGSPTSGSPASGSPASHGLAPSLFRPAFLAFLPALLLFGFFLAAPARAQRAQEPALLYRSGAFALTDTSVRQGPFEAVAESRARITSNYPRAARMVNFKFSLNGADNELIPGEDHAVLLRAASGRIVTPVYTFGQVDAQEAPIPEARVAPPSDSVAVTFRLDLRPVLDSLAARGSYAPPVGAPIERLDGVYVVGNAAPLGWDFGALHPGSRYALRDPDGDGIYTVTLPFDATFNRPLSEGRAVWERSAGLQAFPRYQSGQRLVDALYRLSLEELLQNVRSEAVAEGDGFPAGAFSAGAKWPGVWTRDISYSIVLALAAVAPERSKASLLAKVDSLGRIIQDTGTGGSWPVSTDRMTWALAAWEVYLVTGDDAWLRQAYAVIRRSAAADRHAAFDAETHLFRGESSFLDWREQSYPRWMQPADIYLSEALGTNVVHYGTYRILAAMARQLGRPAEEAARYDTIAAQTKTAVNEYFWQPERGYYGAFRYGGLGLTLAPRAEALGNALAVLRGVAGPDQQERLFARFPVVDYGVPTIYPYAEGIPPYHDESIWPFVVAYWTWAAAKAGQTAATEHGLASLYRSAGLFLTNKENMVATTGHFEGTQVNSDRQLWSVAGTLASVYRVFFGMHYAPDRLVFDPFVPRAYAGERVLEGLRYRGAELTVTLVGYGDAVASATLDGEPIDTPAVPASLSGKHRLTLRLNGALPERTPLRRVDARYLLPTPEAHRSTHEAGRWRGDTLAWAPVRGASRYRIYRGGALVDSTAQTTFALPASSPGALALYQVQATAPDRPASFLSAPVRVVAPEGMYVAEAAGHGDSPAETGRDTGPLSFAVDVEDAGRYAVDVRYANGSGPVNSDNKAALRTLDVDGEARGVVVMPQRGTGAWDDWGYSSPVALRLAEGPHRLRLVFTPHDENMDGRTNRARVEHVRLTKLE